MGTASGIDNNGVAQPAAITAVLIPRSSDYTGFMIQCIDVVPGLDIEGSLDGINWSRLSPDTFFLAQTGPHLLKGMVVTLQLFSPFPGGLRLVSAGGSGEAVLTVSGTALVSMYQRAYPE